MYELKKIGKAFTSKFVRTGPSSYKKRIYGAAVSQRLRNTALVRCICLASHLLCTVRVFRGHASRFCRNELHNPRVVWGSCSMS